MTTPKTKHGIALRAYHDEIALAFHSVRTGLLDDLRALVNLGKPIKPTSGVRRAIREARDSGNDILASRAIDLIV